MVVSIRNHYSRDHVQEIPFDVLRVDSAMQDLIIQPHFIHIFDIPWPGSWRTALIRAYNSRASSSSKQSSASPRLSGLFWGRITMGWRCSKIITSIPKNAPSWNSWKILPCLSCNLEKWSEIHLKKRPSQGIEDTVDMYGSCFMSNYTLRHGKWVAHKVVWFFPSCTPFLPIEGSCTGPRRGLLSRCKWVLGNWKHWEEICGYRWYDQLFLQACQRMASLLFQVPLFPYLKSLRSKYIPRVLTTACQIHQSYRIIQLKYSYMTSSMLRTVLWISSHHSCWHNKSLQHISDTDPTTNGTIGPPHKS